MQLTSQANKLNQMDTEGQKHGPVNLTKKTEHKKEKNNLQALSGVYLPD